MGPIVVMWAAAWAQEPAQPEPEVSEEVIVWGQLAKEKARDAIVDRMAELGWHVVDRSATEIKFRGDRGWLGEATFHSDGTFTYSKPLAGVESPPATLWTAPPVGGHVMPANDIPWVGIGPTFWFLPGPRKLDNERADMLEGVQPQVTAFLAVSRRTEIENEIEVLPDTLDDLWRSGTPLAGRGPPLPTLDARRRAVLEFWATRTDALEGKLVCEAVERWLAAVVQTSDAPITPEERAEYEARRPDHRQLPP